jgi:hypothetical protein
VVALAEQALLRHRRPVDTNIAEQSNEELLSFFKDLWIIFEIYFRHTLYTVAIPKKRIGQSCPIPARITFSKKE